MRSSLGRVCGRQRTRVAASLPGGGAEVAGSSSARANRGNAVSVFWSLGTRWPDVAPKPLWREWPG